MFNGIVGKREVFEFRVGVFVVVAKQFHYGDGGMFHKRADILGSGIPVSYAVVTFPTVCGVCVTKIFLQYSTAANAGRRDVVYHGLNASHEVLTSMLVDLWGEEDVLNVYTPLQKCDVGGVFEGNVIYYAKRVEQLQVLIYGLGSEV